MAETVNSISFTNEQNKKGGCFFFFFLFIFRNLAGGESQKSLSHTYVLAKSTTSNIINETIICKNLNELVSPMPTAQTKLDNSQGFAVRWNYPNAIGTVDGKHIRIQVLKITNDIFVN